MESLHSMFIKVSVNRNNWPCPQCKGQRLKTEKEDSKVAFPLDFPKCYYSSTTKNILSDDTLRNQGTYQQN